MLLDTCLSNSVSNNPRMVKNVEKFKNKDILMAQTNGGLKPCFYVTSLHISLFRFQYNTYPITIILEFKDVANIPGSRITTYV